MENTIKFSVELATLYKVGDEIETYFYDRQQDGYWREVLGKAKIIEICIRYYFIKGKVELLYDCAPIIDGMINYSKSSLKLQNEINPEK